MASGKHFLNLFAYTGGATVYAAGGGAATTTTVDMSNTYIDWAKRNMSINHFAGPQHQFIQADVLQWLGAGGSPSKSDLQPSAFNLQPTKYDLIFVDPPTFSRSKRMADTFDVQRDHAQLLRLVSRLLGPDGLVPRLPGSRRPDGRLHVVALLRTDSAADAVDHICHTAPGSRGVAERNVPQWPAGASR